MSTGRFVDIDGGVQEGTEQVANATVLETPNGLKQCAGNPAQPQPNVGCVFHRPTQVGEGRFKMTKKRCQLRGLVLKALIKATTLSVDGASKVAFNEVNSAQQRDASVRLLSKEQVQSQPVLASLVDDKPVDLRNLFNTFEFPDQPVVPDYDHNKFLDLVSSVTGLDTYEVEQIDTTDGSGLTFYRSLPVRSKLTGDARTTIFLSLSGVPLAGLSEEDLWTLFYTLEHYGEFHALCALYRMFEIAY